MVWIAIFLRSTKSTVMARSSACEENLSDYSSPTSCRSCNSMTTTVSWAITVKGCVWISGDIYSPQMLEDSSNSSCWEDLERKNSNACFLPSLVGGAMCPSWIKWVRQWEGLSHIVWKIKHVWNHQPEIWDGTHRYVIFHTIWDMYYPINQIKLIGVSCREKWDGTHSI